MTYVLLMMPHSALKRKNRALIAITDYSYGAGFDLGGDLTSKDRLKFLYPH